MSNKILIYVAAAILAVGAIAFGYYYWQQTKPLVVTQDQQQNNNPPMAENQPTPQAPTQPSATSTTPQTTNGQCVRDFDQNKLNTAKVSIANREVEMDVKGYGKIVLGFYDKDAPKTVENFLRLTNAGFYDCLTFHRVAKGFVVQGGDPNGDGTGGISAFASLFADELNSDTRSYKAGYVKGTLAMANSGPNTNGSQFFIMLDNVQLQHAYTIFGHVVSGQDVVDKIGQAKITPNLQMNPSGTDGAPTAPIVMTSVKIIK